MTAESLPADLFNFDLNDFAEMTRTERVMAAINGESVDRLPVCFWHHFQPAGSGRKLASATFDFFVADYDLDIVKIMPDIPYPFPHRSIRTVDDLLLLEPIDVARSRYIQQRVETVRALRYSLGPETPIVVTAFSPLAELMYFSETREAALELARAEPTAVHMALNTIAANLRQHNEAVINAGADGVFFALQGCTRSIMSEELYRELGRPYDLIALAGSENGWLNILHVHGESELMFDSVLDYPVEVLSWSDRLAGPSLRDARTKTSKCLMGGWHEFGPLSNGPAQEIQAEAEDAVSQTNGRKLILANGCSVPDDTNPEWLSIAREIVDQLQLP